MDFNQFCRMAFGVIWLSCVMFLPVSSARGETAACCLGDQCQELERTACEDSGGEWLGVLDPAVADCSTTPCSTGACCAGVGCRDNYGGDPFPAEVCEEWDGLYHGGVTCDVTCLTNDRCQYATFVCDQLINDPGIGQCDNDDALDPGPVCSVSLQDCYDGSPCVPWPVDAYRCFVPTDNRGAWTDGPLSGVDCPAGNNNFMNDVWYRISAPCTGQMVIDMCNAAGQYDSMLAVFSDGSAEPSCPGDSNEDLLDAIKALD